MVSAVLGMTNSGEVGEKEEVDQGAMRAIEFGTRYKASFESAHFNSQNRRGMIMSDPAMAAYVLGPSCHDQKT